MAIRVAAVLDPEIVVQKNGNEPEINVLSGGLGNVCHFRGNLAGQPAIQLVSQSTM